MKLPSIQSIMDKYKLIPDKKHSKRYGQNFLFDDTILERIVTFARIPEKAFVLEIGPGPGGLTRKLLAYAPYKMIAVEYDPLCVNALSYLTDHYPNFKLLQGDALKVNLSDMLKNESDDPPCKIHIVANLPYNIGTELLIKWLSEICCIESLTLMFQKEVAERICAAPGNKQYGRLSIIAQNLCTIEHGFNLPPHVFIPAPKIESSVIHFRPKKDAGMYLKYLPTMEKITQAAFHQRRKQIKGPLKSIFGDDTIRILEEVGATGDQRAENLTPSQYLKLAMLSQFH